LLKADRQNTISLINREIEFAYQKINLAPNNECPWNYLRGVTDDLSLLVPNDNHEDNLFKMGDLIGFCENLRGRNILSPHLLSLQADIHIRQNQFPEAIKLFELLADNIDTIHQKYWNYRKSQISS